MGQAGAVMTKFLGLEKLFGSKEMRVLMLGLDAAGKTSVLFSLKLEQDVTTIPTVGFNVETVTFKKTKFHVWDVGGQDKIRPLWRHYYSGTNGLVFVIDSTDVDRMGEAKLELQKIIADREMASALILVFANKQDMKDRALNPEEVCNKLELNKIAAGRTWKVQPSSATTGEGIFEGLAWLTSQLPDSPKHRQ